MLAYLFKCPKMDSMAKWEVRGSIIYCPQTGRQCAYSDHCSSVKKSLKKTALSMSTVSEVASYGLPPELAEPVESDFCSERQLAVMGSYAAQPELDPSVKNEVEAAHNYLRVVRTHIVLQQY